MQHAAGRAADYARAAHADTCGTTRLIDRRDRALLLLLGLASALRRSELAALALADRDFVAEGVRLALARSKTDQEAAGQIVGVVATVA